MLIAQISDCHLSAPGELTFGHVDTAAALARVVAHVNATHPLPDLAVVTGDLTNRGTRAESAEAARILEGLACPFIVIPGNHDQRSVLHAAFGQWEGGLDPDGFMNQARDLGPLTLLALDTLDEGRPGGAFCPARLGWLEAELARAAGREIVVFTHHPPVPLGLPETDADGFIGADALLDALAAHGVVLRICAGHVHLASTTLAAGMPLVTAPPVAMHLARDLAESGAPSGFITTPPGYLMHHLTRAGRLVSHVIALPEAAPDMPEPAQKVYPFTAITGAHT